MKLDNLMKIIKKELEITNVPPKGPSYILPDGSYIDIYASGFRTHGSIDDWLLEENIIDLEDLDNGPILMQLGAIRVNDGSNFGGESLIDLPEENITKYQLYSLEDWLNYQMIKKPWVDISKGSTLENFLFKVDSIKDIINYIKRLYLQ